MINYILGGVVFGLMIFTAIRIVGKSKKESGICGGRCSGCHSKCNSE